MKRPSFRGPSLEFEFQAGYPKSIIVGADEVGRGCLAGPVVAAAVALPTEINFERDLWLSEVNDSKKLNSRSRDFLAPLIQKWAKAVGVGFATVEEIDQINIFHASHLAITRALESLNLQPHHILIDGKFLPKNLPAPASAVIKGDSRCLSIAAASIVAKVWRDRLMDDMELKFPGYGFSQHKGYPTPAHQQALKKQGICEIHRRSFRTVSQLLV